MGGGEIAIIIVIALIIITCVILYLSNSKKIKQKAKLEKENKEKSEVKPEEKAKDETKEKVKKIVQENSIQVENYIKDALLEDEIKAEALNKSIKFEEVSQEEILKPVDNGDFESGAIILGQKQTVVHTFAEYEEDDEDVGGMNTISITNELDSVEDEIISSKHKEFNIKRNKEDVIDKTVGSEINNLSKNAKAVVISGLFDKIDE